MARILVIDDRESNRQVLTTLLGYRQHIVLEAADGAEGLERAASERPDLIITDVLMPTMDGYELVARLRAMPAMAATPIVFYTAHFLGAEARRLADACGVRHVLTKPVEPAEVLRIVQEALADTDRSGAMPADFEAARQRLIADKLMDTSDSLQATIAKLQVLTGLAQQFASERDPMRLLGMLCRSARELVGGRQAVLAARDRYDESHWQLWSYGLGQPLAADQSAPPSSSVLGSLLHDRMSIRISPVTQTPAELGLPPGHPPMTSMVAARIASLSRVYGWVCLSGKLGADGFSEEDESLLSALAMLAGRVYENGRLYAEAKERTRELEREIVERLDFQHQLEERLRYESLVADISSRLNEMPLDDADAGLAALLGTVGEFLGADRASIYLVDDDAEEIVQSYRWATAGYELPDFVSRLPLSAWLRQRLLEQSVLAVDSPDELSDDAAAEREALEAFGVQSAIGVALKPSGHLRGFVMAAAVRTQRKWTADQHRLCKLLGEMLGNFFERRRSRLELEARVYERTLELTAANSELESFAHTVAHDLKAPLRSINGFAQLLSSEYAQKLDDSGRAYLESIIGGTLRMSEVLEGLQRLSLVTAHPLQRQSVDVSAIAHEVAADLTRGDPARNVTFAIEEGLTLYGDRALLRVVLGNLLGNAWKYTGRRDSAHIEVTSRRDGDVLEICVRDDGIGFDEQYADRLFRAFQRLHRSDEFEGTGLGLATVSRIVHRHGGTVRAEGAPDRGAAFCFTVGARAA